MATRKCIKISRNYAAPHILHALFIHMYFVRQKIERTDQIVFFTFFLKLNDHPTRCFNFGLS